MKRSELFTTKGKVPESSNNQRVTFEDRTTWIQVRPYINLNPGHLPGVIISEDKKRLEIYGSANSRKGGAGYFESVGHQLMYKEELKLLEEISIRVHYIWRPYFQDLVRFIKEIWNMNENIVVNWYYDKDELLKEEPYGIELGEELKEKILAPTNIIAVQKIYVDVDKQER